MKLNNPKILKTTKILNTILCILCVVIFIGQMYLMFQPYFKYQAKLTLKQKMGKEPVPAPRIVSLESFVWVEYPDMTNFFLDGTEANEEDGVEQIDGLFAAGVLEEVELANGKTTTNGRTKGDIVHPDVQNQLGQMSNSFVMGIVGTTVLGLVVVIMTIFTRKSTVAFCFSLAWAGCSLYMVLADNYVLQSMGMSHTQAQILQPLTYLAYAAIALVVLRAFPWFCTRYVEKPKFLPEEVEAETVKAA